MGREVRMVPPNWDHPKRENCPDQYQPMFDRPFSEAAADWKANFAKWEAGKRPDYCDEDSRNLEYWEWESNPPDRKYHVPFTEAEATWFQLWETVSEGTPVSPPFATKDELAAYLAEHGDFWDQSRSREGRFGFERGQPTGWGIERAAAFVKAGWAPSMMVMPGVGVLDSKDIPAALAQSST